MKVYDVEVIVEHRYIVKSTGANEIDAGNVGLQWVMDNEDNLTAEDLDGRVARVTIAGGK